MKYTDNEETDGGDVGAGGDLNNDDLIIESPSPFHLDQDLPRCLEEESPRPVSQLGFVANDIDGGMAEGDGNVVVVNGMLFLCVLCVSFRLYVVFVCI